MRNASISGTTCATQQVRLRKELNEKQRELKKAQRRERMLKKKAALLDNDALVGHLIMRAQSLATESAPDAAAAAEKTEADDSME